MLELIKPCKGKDLFKVPASKLIDDDKWNASIKRDGNYVQIRKKGDEVVLLTSGGKQLAMEWFAKKIRAIFQCYDVTLSTEFVYDYNVNKGKLGSRRLCGILNTYRVNYNKGIDTPQDDKCHFHVFDILELTKTIGGVEVIVDNTTTYKDRYVAMLTYITGFKHLSAAISHKGTLAELKNRTHALVNEGYEGMFLFHDSHLNRAGKRVNDAVKIKYRPTADLLCVGVTPGEGKYEGLIGALELVDSKGLKVSVGSGLSDADRALLPSVYLNRVIEIAYEQKLDTYIQPVFKYLRLNKVASEID